MEDNNCKESATILCLNDDCLEEICKNLELRDRLLFADVCQRFRDIAQMSFKLQSKVIDTSILSPLTMSEMRRYLDITGMFFEEFTIAKMKTRKHKVLANIINCCPNIKLMRFDNTNMNQLTNLFEHMNKLLELEFIGLYLSCEVFQLVTKLPKLKALTLTRCELNDAAENIRQLTHLKKLIIHGGQVTNMNFTAIFQTFRQLEELRITDIEHEFKFCGISERCPKLHTLCIQCNERSFACECIAELPNLKHLTLQDCYEQPTESLLLALAENSTNALEYLSISERLSQTFLTDGKIWTQTMQHVGRLKKLKQLLLHINPFDNDCLQKLGTLENLEEFSLPLDFAITNDKLFDFLRKCTNLKLINIQNCHNITMQFIQKVLKLQLEREQELVISIERIHNTSFYTYDLQEIAASKFLKLDIKKGHRHLNLNDC